MGFIKIIWSTCTKPEGEECPQISFIRACGGCKYLVPVDKNEI